MVFLYSSNNICIMSDNTSQDFYSSIAGADFIYEKRTYFENHYERLKYENIRLNRDRKQDIYRDEQGSLFPISAWLASEAVICRYKIT